MKPKGFVCASLVWVRFAGEVRFELVSKKESTQAESKVRQENEPERAEVSLVEPDQHLSDKLDEAKAK